MNFMKRVLFIITAIILLSFINDSKTVLASPIEACTNNENGDASLELNAKFTNSPTNLDLGPRYESTTFDVEVNYKVSINTVDAFYEVGDLEIIIPHFFKSQFVSISNSNHFEVVDTNYLDPITGKRALKLVNNVKILPGDYGVIKLGAIIDLEYQPIVSFFSVEKDNSINKAYYKDSEWYSSISGKVTYSDSCAEVASNSTANKLSVKMELVKQPYTINKSSRTMNNVPKSLIGQEDDYYWVEYKLSYLVDKSQALWTIWEGNLVDKLPKDAELVRVISENSGVIYEIGTDNSTSKVHYNTVDNIVTIPLSNAYVQVRYPKSIFNDASQPENFVDIVGYYKGETKDDSSVLASDNDIVTIGLKRFEFVNNTGDSGDSNNYTVFKEFYDKSPLYVNPLKTDILGYSQYSLGFYKAVVTEPVDIVIGDDLRLWEYNNKLPNYEIIEGDSHYVDMLFISGLPIGVSSGEVELYVLKAGQSGEIENYEKFPLPVKPQPSRLGPVYIGKDKQVVAYYVVYKGVTGTVNQYLVAAKEFIKPIDNFDSFTQGEPTYLHNIVFMDVWKEDTQSTLFDINSSQYSGTFAQQLAQRDLDLYGHYLLRKDASLPVQFDFIAPEVFKDMKYNVLANTITAEIRIQASYDGPVFDFQIEDTLPAGMKISSYYIDTNSPFEDNYGYNVPHFIEFVETPNQDGSTHYKWVFNSDVTNNERIERTSHMYTEYGVIKIIFEIETINDWFGYQGVNYTNFAYGFNEGKINEVENRSSASAKVLIPSSLDANGLGMSKRVSINDGDTWSRAEEVITKENFKYKLSFTTQQNSISNVVIYDNLPFQGDVFNEGNNASRKSEFIVNLANSSFDVTLSNITEDLPIGYKIYYSRLTTKDAGKNDMINSNWVLATDWTESLDNVKSFSIVIDKSQIISVGETVNVIFDVYTSSDEIIKKAYNTFHIEFNDISDNAVTTESNAVVVSVKPAVIAPTIEKNVEGIQELNLSKIEAEFTWNIVTNFGNDAHNWQTLSVTDDIHESLEVVEITIKDEKKNDVKDKFNIVDNNKNSYTFELLKVADTFSYLNGSTYTISITTKLKASQDIQKIIDEGGIKNDATIIFGNGSSNITSNKPIVKLPVQSPSIEKSVNGALEIELMNRDDIFTWEITTSFGNGTTDWVEAIISDSVNKSLDIIDVRVTEKDDNADGSDVTNNGKLLIDENNNISFSIYSEDDSFTYLGGKTYVISIDAKIKSSITDIDLEQYLVDNALINEAVITFGNSGSFLTSNIAKVTPPVDKDKPPVDEVKPPVDKDKQPVDGNELPVYKKTTINKTVNNAKEITLVNKEDHFTWRIITKFNNDVISSESVAIVDSFNEYLDIVSIKLINAKGIDITENAIVIIKDNVLRIELQKINGSFSYLGDETYTVEIHSSLNKDVSQKVYNSLVNGGGIINVSSVQLDETEITSNEATVKFPPISLPNTGLSNNALFKSIIVVGVTILINLKRKRNLL